MDLLFWITYVALWLVVALQGFAFLELLRQNAQMREALNVYEGPKEQTDIYRVGEELPASQARQALTGEPVRWAERLGSELSILVILHPGCLTCHSVADGLPKLVASADSRTAVIPVVEGRNLEAAQAFMEELRLDPASTVLDEEPSLSRALNVTVKPAAVVLHGRTVARASTVQSASQVEVLILDAQRRLQARRREAEARPAAAVADPAV
jgi:hypothetical protein